jgi:hypothetical protein
MFVTLSTATYTESNLGSLVAPLHNRWKYLFMAFPVQVVVEGLQTLHTLMFWTVGNYANSLHTCPPVSTYPSSYIVYPEVHTSLPSADVQLI